MTGRPLAGEVKHLRADLDNIGQSALSAVAPEACMRQALQLEGTRLHVAGDAIDLSQIRHITVVGMGKASARMAAALENLLGDRISGGLVVTADGYKVDTRSVEIIEASHPVPDTRGLVAAERIVALVEEARAHWGAPGDL